MADIADRRGSSVVFGPGSKRTTKWTLIKSIGTYLHWRILTVKGEDLNGRVVRYQSCSQAFGDGHETSFEVSAINSVSPASSARGLV